MRLSDPLPTLHPPPPPKQDQDEQDHEIVNSYYEGEEFMQARLLCTRVLCAIWHGGWWEGCMQARLMYCVLYGMA